MVIAITAILASLAIPSRMGSVTHSKSDKDPRTSGTL
jgi:Tfp pilus assembly protein FimT